MMGRSCRICVISFGEEPVHIGLAKQGTSGLGRLGQLLIWNGADEMRDEIRLLIMSCIGDLASRPSTIF
jgi:hypothetical protein